MKLKKLIIFPVICLCLTGCANNKKVSYAPYVNEVEASNTTADKTESENTLADVKETLYAKNLLSKYLAKTGTLTLENYRSDKLYSVTEYSKQDDGIAVKECVLNQDNPSKYDVCSEEIFTDNYSILYYSTVEEINSKTNTVNTVYFTIHKPDDTVTEESPLFLKDPFFNIKDIEVTSIEDSEDGTSYTVHNKDAGTCTISVNKADDVISSVTDKYSTTTVQYNPYLFAKDVKSNISEGNSLKNITIHCPNKDFELSIKKDVPFRFYAGETDLSKIIFADESYTKPYNLNNISSNNDMEVWIKAL